MTFWVKFINDVGNHQDFYRPFHINIKYGFSIIFNSQKLSHFGLVQWEKNVKKTIKMSRSLKPAMGNQNQSCFVLNASKKSKRIIYRLCNTTKHVPNMLGVLITQRNSKIPTKNLNLRIPIKWKILLMTILRIRS